MKLEKKIKEILPNASVRVCVEEKTETVTANVAELDATEMKQLLRFGLKKVKRSGSGLTLKFEL